MENNKRMCLNIGDPPMPKDPLNIHVSIMKNMNSSKNPFFNNELWIAVRGFTIKLPETNSSPMKKNLLLQRERIILEPLLFNGKLLLNFWGPYYSNKPKQDSKNQKKHNFTENPTALDNLKKSRWILNEEVPNNIESEPQTNPWLQFFFLLSPFWFFRSEHQNLDLLEVVGQNKQYSPKWWFIGDLP